MNWQKPFTAPCAEVSNRLVAASGLSALLLALMAGCATAPKEEAPPVAHTPAPVPANKASKPAPSVPGTSPQAAPGKLSAPSAPRDWAEARLQAAKRIVAANPDITYMGKPPDLLLAIPILTIELNGDGSIKNIAVMRPPSQARETVDIAMAAVRKAAPFGDVSRLPKPWKFNETFLFNADHKFKPMTLDRQ
jgi:hypothetical protein